MKWQFVDKCGSRRLLLIFTGWSTTPALFSNLRHPGWDIIVAYDYSDLLFPQEILQGYDTIALFAWSMGVYAASQSLPFDKITLAVAINGTEHPADDALGIPVKIFRGTADSLSPRNLLKFRLRMAGKGYADIPGFCEDNDIESLKSQLYFILNHNAEKKATTWHRAYVSTSDLIFPPANQRRAWESHHSAPRISEIDALHFTDIGKIIRASLPDCEKVGKRFHKALDTYDTEATAQTIIAEKLAKMCTKATTFRRVAEIGPGSGIFTRAYAAEMKPESIDFIDLYSLPRFDVAPIENYHVENAEHWMAREAAICKERFDAIVSASVMQWFVNPELFLENASSLLRVGGTLAVSTFLPGTLGELHDLNPFGLIYRPADEIKAMVRRHFPSASFEEEEIVMQFDNPRSTLLHLSRTGVGGGIPSSQPLSALLSKFPIRLTYRPLYIIAHKQD